MKKHKKIFWDFAEHKKTIILFFFVFFGALTSDFEKNILLHNSDEAKLSDDLQKCLIEKAFVFIYYKCLILQNQSITLKIIVYKTEVWDFVNIKVHSQCCILFYF